MSLDYGDTTMCLFSLYFCFKISASASFCCFVRAFLGAGISSTGGFGTTFRLSAATDNRLVAKLCVSCSWPSRIKFLLLSSSVSSPTVRPTRCTYRITPCNGMACVAILQTPVTATEPFGGVHSHNSACGAASLKCEKNWSGWKKSQCSSTWPLLCCELFTDAVVFFSFASCAESSTSNNSPV